ncbi:putative GTPase [Saccharomycopsis crataegensis]|uniref:GPN-loop GTPase 2 n=1 Tax=Saccharomycopsis crataegensis TaxID=43959 RepID=A0AAV5QS34_9ASCO|nr:putative GTPase [Saccharomycopsis crataegensis]
MPIFGQVIIGPPGSGKSTYCYGLQQFFNSIGRHSIIINLDLANDKLKYDCALDLRDFITLEEIMSENSLGPNGGLIKAFETLTGVSDSGADKSDDGEEDNLFDVLLNEITNIVDKSNAYVIFDTPGQSELFTSNFSLPNLFKELGKRSDLRLCCVNLMDSIYLTSPSSYISILLTALRSMLLLNMPHVNVISKVDLLANYDKLPFNLKYYLEVDNLEELIPLLEKEMSYSKNKLGTKNLLKITESIIDLVDDYKMVDFEVLCVEDTRSMINLVRRIDKANGYAFGENEISGDSTWIEASRLTGTSANGLSDVWGEEIDIQERWIDYKDEYDAQVKSEQDKAMEMIKKRESELQKGHDAADAEDEYERDLANWKKDHPFQK